MHKNWYVAPASSTTLAEQLLLECVATVTLEERLELLRAHAATTVRHLRVLVREGAPARCRGDIPLEDDLGPSEQRLRTWRLRQAALNLDDADARSFAIACADHFAGSPEELWAVARAVAERLGR